MTVSALDGLVGFGPQAAMESVAETWFRHRATQVDLAVIDPVQLGTPEVGGLAVPSFPYKTGPMVSGGITIQPRLEDTLGYLLWGLLGYKESSTETGLGTGIYDHVFTLDPDLSTYIPWLSFRKLIPRRGTDTNTDLGEIYTDCKIVGATLTLPNEGPITLRLEILGRKFEEDPDPDLWVWENDLEHWESIPVACATGGYIKIGGDDLRVSALVITFQNSPLDPRQEKIYGDPYLEDVTVVYRQLGYNLVVKWNDPELYLQTLTGAVDGTQWSAHPYTATFDAKAISSVNMPTETEPYSLRIEADEVMMSQVGGIELGGNNAVMIRFQGVALEAAQYAKFTLRNKQSTYTWPTVGS